MFAFVCLNCFDVFEFADWILSCVSSRHFGSLSFATMCGLVVPIALAHAGCILLGAWFAARDLCSGLRPPSEHGIVASVPAQTLKYNSEQLPCAISHWHLSRRSEIEQEVKTCFAKRLTLQNWRGAPRHADACNFKPLGRRAEVLRADAGLVPEARSKRDDLPFNVKAFAVAATESPLARASSFLRTQSMCSASTRTSNIGIPWNLAQGMPLLTTRI